MTHVLLSNGRLGRGLVLLVGRRDLAQALALGLRDGLVLLDVLLGAVELAPDRAELVTRANLRQSDADARGEAMLTEDPQP